MIHYRVTVYQCAAEGCDEQAIVDGSMAWGEQMPQPAGWYSLAPPPPDDEGVRWQREAFHSLLCLARWSVGGLRAQLVAKRPAAAEKSA